MRNPFRRQQQNLDRNKNDVPVSSSKASSTSEGSTSEDENKTRGNWSSQIEFTLSCVGYTVGLGNIWRFPYLCMRNGGGAFLIPYFIFLFFCGLPLYFLELIIGQFSSLSPCTVWKICPIAKGVGHGMLILSTIVVIYYDVILAWVLFFLGMSFRKDVPWRTCDNPWNTETCVMGFNMGGNHSTRTFVHSPLDNNISESGGPTTMNVYNMTAYRSGGRSAAEEFWTNKVLNISSGIDDPVRIKWDLCLCLLAGWVLAFLCLSKGIKSSGKVVYVTAILPYVFLTILLVRGATLPGSLQGIKFYIIPKWERLLDFSIWAEACLQVFYSLGPAWGGIITMASYNRFNNNCLTDAVIVCVCCGGTSFFAGFVIFAAIGYMAHSTGLPVDEVITQGPGLAFVAYPDVLANLPISPFWAICFFLMLLSLGLGSQFASIETVVSGLIDRFPDQLRDKKTLVLFAVTVIFFLCGLPLVTQGGMYVFQLLDWYIAACSVTLFALIETVIVSYFYGIGRFYHDIELMLQRKLSLMWAVCWCFIVPVLLFSIIVISAVRMKPPKYGDYVYPVWAIVLGWFVATVPLLPIPVVVISEMVKAKGSFMKRLYTLIQPEPDWGPTLEEYRKEYKYATHNYSWRDRMSIWKSRGVSLNTDENIPEKVALTSV